LKAQKDKLLVVVTALNTLPEGFRVEAYDVIAPLPIVPVPKQMKPLEDTRRVV
jgi:hypothetical protein